MDLVGLLMPAATPPSTPSHNSGHSGVLSKPVTPEGFFVVHVSWRRTRPRDKAEEFSRLSRSSSTEVTLTEDGLSDCVAVGALHQEMFNSCPPEWIFISNLWNTSDSAPKENLHIRVGITDHHVGQGCVFLSLSSFRLLLLLLISSL